MIDIKTLYFDDFEGFACKATDDYTSCEDKFSAISVIAKFKESKEIIKAFIYMGFDIGSIEIDEEVDEYCDEYLVTIDDDRIYCEKYKRENGYFTDFSTITYISNDCNSALLPHVKSKIIYAFEINDCNDECDCYIEDFQDESDISSDDDKITIKCELDADQALKTINEMERKMVHISKIFDELDQWQKLIHW